MVRQPGICAAGGGQRRRHRRVLLGFDNQPAAVVAVPDKVEDRRIVDAAVAWDGKQPGAHRLVKAQVFPIQTPQHLRTHVFQMQMADTVAIFVQYARDLDPGDKGVPGIKRQPDVVMGVRQKPLQLVIVLHQHHQMMVIGQLEVIVAQQQVSKGIQLVAIRRKADAA
ncbi:Uncharacterised protein [Klebsiella pneumoniae]|nr:Uncharacterised protein [Klebsiella pneumoniae]